MTICSHSWDNQEARETVEVEEEALEHSRSQVSQDFLEQAGKAGEEEERSRVRSASSDECDNR